MEVHRPPLNSKPQQEWRLREPIFGDPASLEEALGQRRSVRRYVPVALLLAGVAQLFWAAQGITNAEFVTGHDLL